MGRRKVYVKVNADFSPEGECHPNSITFEDGQLYEIDRVLHSCRAASTKVGGTGIRYVEAGHGLIKVGSSLVTFANKFPKNTKLYKLMTTKPGEGA